MPISSVVMPCRTFGSCCGSARITSPECACMSMNPGQTTRPVASMTRRASMPAVSPRRNADALVLDSDGAVEARVARAVDDEPSADEQVEHVGSPRRRRFDQCPTNR